MTNRTGFMRHIQACTDAELPGDRVAFRVGDQAVGWIRPDMLDDLAAFPSLRFAPDNISLTDPAALPAIAQALSEQGYFRWRREEFDVRASPEGPALARIDRGAIPVGRLNGPKARLRLLVGDALGLDARTLFPVR